MTTVKLSEITPDDRNANIHTERGTYMLRRSLERFGFLEPGVLDANNRIIGGNHRTEAAADVLDASEAIVIDIDGKTPVFVRRKDIDLSTAAGREAAVALNRTAQVGIEFDPTILMEYLDAGVDLGDWFYMDDGEDEPAADDVQAVEDVPLPQGVPSAVWPSDNEWGIATLDIERQADAVDFPVETWGAKGRTRYAGTYHFYTDDGRFNSIWDKPDMVVKAGCVNAVEPNYSVTSQSPRALALWNTYRKRWLARYWQTKGIRIIVDLNTSVPHHDINMMGVPKGWKAFSTRGYSSQLDALDAELEIARDWSGIKSPLFMVYGGGAKVREWCMANSALWVPEDMDRAKGRYVDAYNELKKGE